MVFSGQAPPAFEKAVASVESFQVNGRLYTRQAARRVSPQPMASQRAPVDRSSIAHRSGESSAFSVSESRGSPAAQAQEADKDIFLYAAISLSAVTPRRVSLRFGDNPHSVKLVTISDNWPSVDMLSPEGTGILVDSAHDELTWETR